MRRNQLAAFLLLIAVGIFAIGILRSDTDPSGVIDATAVRLVQTAQTSGTDQLLQAVSPVNERVVWVSGHGGTFAVTSDGGESWRARVMPGADTLQFRDVDAFDDQTAFMLSAGTGELSRIYKTVDGGDTWALQFQNEHPDGFLDCMAFWDSETGVAYGDAVDGELFILRTEDGGESWTRVPAGGLPAAQEGEGGFAASGTCVDTGAQGRGWIATGNGARSRILLTEDFGKNWRAVETPIQGGAAAGLTTVGFVGDDIGFAMGGVIGQDSVRVDNVTRTTDGGMSWQLAGRPRMAGPIYGAAWIPGVPGPALFAVGPRGADYSLDGGLTWLLADTQSYWAVGFASPTAGWAVGPGGRITRFSLQPS